MVVPQGRGGRGSIYVWASGDGGHNDDCNCDGYAASMWTISINSATNDGQTASYDESCSSTLASTFSNGKSGYQDAGVVSLNTPLCLCLYREMLCIARTMPSQNACLPVRHTPVFCRTPLNKSSNFFSPPGSHTILVFFPYQTVWQYSGRDPPNLGKNRDFRPISGFGIDNCWSVECSQQ